MYYWTVGFLQSHNNLSPNFFLLWEMIKWFKSKGFESFDFVRIERDRLPGIARFKLSWGGQIVNYNIARHRGFFNKLISRKNNK